MFNRFLFAWASLALVLSLSPKAYAQQSPNFVYCTNEIEQLLNIEESKNLWSLSYSNSKSSVFTSPTQNIGRWILVIEFANQNLEIRVLSKQENFVFKIDESCRLERETSSPDRRNQTLLNSEFELFTDQDLIETVDISESGVIYMWSPRFVYSVRHYNEAKETVEALGLNFTAVMRSQNDDMGFLDQDIEYVMQTIGEPVLLNNSLELEMRELGLHSPSFLLYKDGQILPDIIVGVHTPRSLRQQLRILR